MKLYATITSERASKGQGGKDLMIEIYGEDREEVCRIKVTRPPFIDYLVQVFPVAYPQKLMLEVKGHGYELKRKGNKQKGESDLDPWQSCENHAHYSAGCSLCRDLNNV